MRALDRLKKAANLVPVKKVVTLSNGEDLEFWMTPLTMAQRERAEKLAGGTENVGAFALQLMIIKAMDEQGQPLFAAAEAAELKNETRDSDLQNIMLAIIKNEEAIKEDEAKN